MLEVGHHGRQEREPVGLPVLLDPLLPGKLLEDAGELPGGQPADVAGGPPEGVSEADENRRVSPAWTRPMSGPATRRTP